MAIYYSTHVYWIDWIYCTNVYWLLSSIMYCVWNPKICQFEFIHAPVVRTCNLYVHTKYRHDLRLIYSVTNIKYGWFHVGKAWPRL